MGISRENREQQTEWDLHETQDQTPIEINLQGEVSPELFGIEPVKAQEMVSGLTTVFAEREALKNAYIDVISLPVTAENLSTFKELRLKIVKNRTQGIEKWHKTNKAFYLAGGRFVDAIKNKEVLENEQMEEKLLEAEKYFENIEKERLAKLKAERGELLQPFVDVLPNDLENLEQDVFDSFLATKKAAYTARIEAERAEAERIENERIEREKQIEAQRLENERLKKEAAEKEAQILAERKAAEAHQKSIEEKAAKEAAELKAKQDDELAKEREATAKAEAELAKQKQSEAEAKKQAEAKAEAERKEAEKLAKAPVKKQMSVWVESFALPVVGVENETSKEIKEKFEAFKKWSINQINNL